MGNKIADIELITDDGQLIHVVLHTSDHSLQITVTQNNRYLVKMDAILGSGIKMLSRIRQYMPFEIKDN